MRRLAPLVGTALLLPALAAAQAPPGAARCEVAARIFIEGLVPEQSKRVVVPFDHAARRAPMYPPGASPALTGVRTGELAKGQRVRLHDLLTCALSSQGYQKTLAIMRRSEIVKENLAKLPQEQRETRADVGGDFFWITIFGQPAPDKPWGWRLEGHHLELNFTVVDGRIAATPAMMAADPAVMTDLPWAGFRVLDAEFTRGLELMESLTPEQRARAVVAPAPPPALLLPTGGAQPAAKPPAGQGLPAAALNEAQRAMLWRLVDEYVGNLESGTAERLRARIRADGIEKVYFAWMGPTARGQPVYYRVQGPSIAIEFLDAPKAGSAAQEPDINHIHTWWQAGADDFGDDLVKAQAGKGGGT